MEEKKKQLVQQLLRHYGNDAIQVKRLGLDCKAIGFDLGIEKNIDAIADKPEWFLLIITYSDLGILTKLRDVLEQLKQ